MYWSGHFQDLKEFSFLRIKNLCMIYTTFSLKDYERFCAEWGKIFSGQCENLIFSYRRSHSFFPQ